MRDHEEIDGIEDQATESPVAESVGRCGSCGNDLRSKARFCDVCGSPVAPVPAISEHKQVTVLFADVVGSMKLAATLDAERLQETMNELFNRAAAVVQRYQGTVDKFTGDGLMALFGAPLALEDHALRACISALEIQSVTKELAAEVLRRDGVGLQIRVGLNSGEVIAGEIGSGAGRYTAVGHTVGMAQRMEAAAPPGGVLCSLSTARLVEGATRLDGVEEIAVKGADAPTPARRLLAVESGRMVVGRSEGLMLGRDAELDWLQSLFDANRGCFVGVVGAPGVGKSRLINEFAAVAAGRNADVVVARCEAHTTTLPFRALSRLLRAMFTVDGLSDSDAREHTVAQFGEVRFEPHSADAQILFDAMGIADVNGPHVQVSADGRRRRLVEVMAQAVLARSTRNVLVLEDVHWIDTPSDEVLADFADTLNMTPSIFVTTYRPEFRGALQHRSAQTITVQPLSHAMAMRLVGQLLGNDPSLALLAERIAIAAVGNPFFVEEIVRDLAGRGVLAGSRGNYSLTRNVDEIAVPATVQAVLAARIDRLPAQSKSLLNAAAVVGNHFDVDTLRALLPETDVARLADLVSAELIDQTEFVPQQRYCFHHPLVRTVAYESQLSTTRARAHSRLAAAIEARDRSEGDENATLIANHLEAAGEPAKAYHWYLRAAEWLRSRDLPAARTQWESARRIAERLPEGRDDVIAMRIKPLTMLISTALYVGDDLDADERYRELRGLAMRTGDTTSLAIATAGRIMSFAFNDLRVPEAATLASELEDMVGDIDCDAATKSVILNSVAFARALDCDFKSALRVIGAIRAMADVPMVELGPANALLGLIETCCGDNGPGRRHLREGTEHARRVSPVVYAQVMFFSGILVALGIFRANDLVDEIRDAMRSAESFGDVSGVVAGQWAYGTALLRAGAASHDDAIDVLERARTSMQNRKVLAVAQATLEADLAIDAARKGRRDEAIDDLRALQRLHMKSGSRIFVVGAGEALVELLIDRGSPDDLAEAHRIVDEWQAQRPGIPALDLWWLKSHALLANAEGDAHGYFTLAKQYVALCQKLDARGRLDEACQMVNEKP